MQNPASHVIVLAVCSMRHRMSTLKPWIWNPELNNHSDEKEV